MEKHAESVKTKRRTVLRWVVDIMIIIAASAVYSLGVHCFISPNSIAPGGVTGIAITVSGNTVFTDVMGELVPTYSAEGGNGIMAALFGGALMGIGLGLNYQREGTSGGTDIVIKMIQKLNPDLKIGAITAALDIFVVGLGMLVYRDINVVLFAVVAIFIQSKFIDFLVYGNQESRFLMIFSEHSADISQRLLAQNRGVTLFKAEGAYSGKERPVIATAVHRTAYSKVKRIIRETDPNAFVITTSAGEVLGQGFGKLTM